MSSTTPDDEAKIPQIKPLFATKRLNTMLNARFPNLMKQLRFVSIDVVRGLRLGGPELKLCISMADSHVSGDRTPSPSHVSLLARILGIGTCFEAFSGSEPMWWVDIYRTEWQWSTSADYGISPGWTRLKKEMSDFRKAVLARSRPSDCSITAPSS